MQSTKKVESEWGKLSPDWKDIEEIIVFGFGSTAQVYFENLSKKVKVRFIIDNSTKFDGKLHKDIPIYSYEKAKIKIGNTKIVIIAETTAYNQISNILIQDGYIENQDFTGLERFICEWFFKKFNLSYIMEMHTTITTACTFNCRKCNMFIPYYKNRKIYSIDELCRNLDLIFQYIDYVFKYQLVGGEPFLNGGLSAFLQYISKEYSNRIGRVRIITNGGVIPSEELLYTMKKCNVEVNISNYLKVIDYKEIFDQVIESLERVKINYQVIPALRWRDFGFPVSHFTRTKEEARKHMLICGTAWHGLNAGCLHYCNSAWSASECGLFSESDRDYIDLNTLTDCVDSKISLLKLCLGDREPGYNSFCQVCGGCGEDNNNIILAGEQM